MHRTYPVTAQAGICREPKPANRSPPMLFTSRRQHSPANESGKTENLHANLADLISSEERIFL